MDGWHAVLATLCITLMFNSVAASNVDTRDHVLINVSTEYCNKCQFGTTLDLKNDGLSPVLYIGAPHMRSDKAGGVFQCHNLEPGMDSICNVISFDGKSGAMGISLQLAGDKENLLVCGNQYTYSCATSSVTQRMVGSCFNVEIEKASYSALPNPCYTPCSGALIADVIFVLDESGSVKYRQFQDQLKWIKQLLNSFSEDIEFGNVRVGIVLFNAEARIVVDLMQYSFSVLSSLISKLRGAGGGTNIEKGTDLAVEMFTNGNRSGVAKQMVVLTDGLSGGDPAAGANRARDMGIVLASVGVGSDYNYNTLLEIAGAARRVFTATDYSNLNTVTEELRSVIEETATTLEGQSTNTSSNLTQCQAGSSLSTSFNNLYIGAVGSYDRAGSIIEYSSAPSTYRVDYIDETLLKDLINPIRFNDFKESYLGYSVATGRFWGGTTEYVASGAPKYKSKGLVLVYEQGITSSSSMHLLHPQEAALWQLGSYFGHSLCTTDLNEDNFDDLLVSAPLYADGFRLYDQGRVFVFWNNASNPGLQEWMSGNYQPQILSGSNSVGARFGMSVVIGGDIDRNGFDDIIIGAPGEEADLDGKGAIYIYFVTNDGISESRKQKILGKGIKPSLNGFGKGILAGVGYGNDMDSNNYPDVVVSAPSSDTVVILFSRPVLDVNVSVATRPSDIDIIHCLSRPSQPCTRFQFCISTRERAASLDKLIAMDIMIELDSSLSGLINKRLLFHGETSSNKQLLSQDITSTPQCFHYDVVLTTSFFTNIATGSSLNILPSVRVTYALSESHQSQPRSSILDPFEQQVAFADWVFVGNCSGEKGTCLYDLQLQTSFSIPQTSEPLILEKNPGFLLIDVILSNLGPDYALYTNMELITGALTLSQVSGSCAQLLSSSPGHAEIVFKLSPSPLLNGFIEVGQSCDFTLKFPLQVLTLNATTPRINIQGKVYSSTRSNAWSEVNSINNKFNFEREVRYSTSIILSRTTIPSNIFYNQTTSPSYAMTLNDEVLGGSQGVISHQYDIYNSGPHVLTTSLMNFSWPASLTSNMTEPLFYLYEFQCQPSSICHCETSGKVNPFNLSLNNQSHSNVSLHFVSPSSVHLSAVTSCKDVYCEAINCIISRLQPFKRVRVTSQFKLWLPTFTEPKFSSVLSSSINLDNSKTLVENSEQLISVTASTLVNKYITPVSNNAPTPDNTAAFVGGIAGGIVGLALSVAIMWKLGFFNSKYAEMKQLMMDEDNATPGGDLPGEGVYDNMAIETS